MFRLFTRNLPFDEKSLLALAGMPTQGCDLAFFIHYLYEEVCHPLPGGTLEFRLSEGLQRLPALSDESAIELLDAL